MTLPAVITPHRAKHDRKAIRERIGELRAELAQIRLLRRSTSLLDREDADGRLAVALHEHDQIRCMLRWLRTVRVEKGSAWSPAAAARRCR